MGRGFRDKPERGERRCGIPRLSRTRRLHSNVLRVSPEGLRRRHARRDVLPSDDRKQQLGRGGRYRNDRSADRDRRRTERPERRLRPRPGETNEGNRPARHRRAFRRGRTRAIKSFAVCYIVFFFFY